MCPYATAHVIGIGHKHLCAVFWFTQRIVNTSGALKGRDCISKLILEVSVPAKLKQLPKSISFNPTLPLSAKAAMVSHKRVRCNQTASVL